MPMGAKRMGAGMRWPKRVAAGEGGTVRSTRGRGHDGARTGEVARVGVDAGAGDDAPAEEGVAVGAVRPASAGVGVGVQVGAVAELCLRRVLQLVGVHGEARDWGRELLAGGQRAGGKGTHAGRWCRRA